MQSAADLPISMAVVFLEKCVTRAHDDATRHIQISRANHFCTERERDDSRKDFRIFHFSLLTMTARMRLVRCSSLHVWLILLSFQRVAIPVLARLQAAVILPHGDFAVDPSLVPANTTEREAADAVAQAAAETGHWLSHHVDPDLIFLSSPHGIALSNDFGIYLGSTASGSADIGKDLHNASHAPYRVHLPTIALDPRLSAQLVDELIALQKNVSAIQVSADDSVDILLQWAEVIPLMLIPPRQKQSRMIPLSPSSPLRHRRLDAVSTSTRPRRHLILSQPLRRYTHAIDMVSELVALGRMFRTWIDARPERVAVVISGDMSHTHRFDGPYGYSDQSSAFDAAVGRWAADPCHQAASLLEEARSLQPKAMSCGFTGMVLLHGMLCSGDDDDMDNENESDDDNEDNGFYDPTTWDAHVRVNRNVTYYGMMVASYERVSN
jgi:aromatic ring-opening dioxygenase LigB subunit